METAFAVHCRPPWCVVQLNRLRLRNHACSSWQAHGASKLIRNCLESPTAGLQAVPFPDRRLAEDVPVPPLRQCRLYLNLTNGIEALPRLQQHGLPFSFVRIQSTACEQQHFEKMMNELDADLLLHLALGHCCIIVDYGSRNKKRGASRAVWFGTEFIRYALARLWGLEREPQAYLRGHTVADVFDCHVRKFSKSTKKRMRYYKRYLPPGGLEEVKLFGAYSSTERDDDSEFYRQTLHTALLRMHEPGAGAAAAAEAPTALSGAEQVGPAFSREDRDALLDGDCHSAVQQLLGLSLFLGGVSHAVLRRLSSSDHGDSDVQQELALQPRC